MSIKHRHASGRWDRSLRLLSNDTERHIEAGARIVTGTEADQEKRERVLREVARKHGFYCQTGDGGTNDDCWALIDKGVFKVVYAANLPVESNRGGPSTRPEAVFLVLEDVATGVRFLVTVMHLPHGVGLLDKITTLTKRWRIEARDWHRQALALAKEHGCVGGLMCGDWNVNLRSKRVRTAIGKEMPGVRLWPTIPVKGTHAGGRLIDFTVTFGDVQASSPTILPFTSASDHAAYDETVTWTAPKPAPPKETHMPRQARSLDVLLAEANRLAPHRSKKSDGGLGDQAHAARTSDHNPNGQGVWRARDFTHDPKGGFDADVFAESVASKLGKHPALGAGAYVIRNRRIISTNRLSEGWRRYTGSNPHTKHAHVSVATAASGYDNTTPWHINVTSQKDWFDMATKADLQAAIREMKFDIEGGGGKTKQWTIGQVLHNLEHDQDDLRKRVIALDGKLDQLLAANSKAVK